MVTSGDAVKVMDFGVAAGADLSRLSFTGIVGTPHYLAPELAEGETADARADVYSLGVILFEMVTGERPYDAEDAASIVQRKVLTPMDTPDDQTLTKRLLDFQDYYQETAKSFN